MAIEVGTRLDRYQIDAELGRGAMGVVYRARDPKLDRTVAIKTVSLSNLDAESVLEFRKRFVVEAQAAGRLAHPGIVTIFDVREEPEPFLVMEYVEGQSLQQLITRENRTLPLTTTLALIQEVAEALHYAHAQGVVHRDIKPANILVTPDGHPKIADFGVAKLNRAELTLPGQVLGSPAFMAPEQLNEEGVDARSDLFSLGVILYYMLTGHRPFQGNSTTTVCFKLVNHEPLPVSAFESKFSPELDKIVSRAMAKDPAQRYQSGLALASDLQELRERSGFLPGNVKGSEASGGIPRPAVEGAKKFYARSARFLSAALVSALMLIAIASAVFWKMHSAKSNAAASVKTDGALRKVGASKVSARKVGSIKDDLIDTDSADGTSIDEHSINEHSAKSLTADPHNDKIKSRKTAIPAPAPVPAQAILQIEVQHPFANATASVWLDERLVYTQSLRGEKQRRGLLFHRVAGHQFNAIKVSAGKHQVRVQVESAADSYNQSKIIPNASIQDASLLRIICDTKSGGLQLTLQEAAGQ